MSRWMLFGRSLHASDDEFACVLAQQLSIPYASWRCMAFGDGEISVQLADDAVVQDKHCFVVYRFDYSNGDGCTFNHEQEILQLLFLVQLLRASGSASITLVLPYLPYSRQDMLADTPTSSLQTLCALFKAVGVERIITLDVHNPKVIDNTFITAGSSQSIVLPIIAMVQRRYREPLLLVSPDQGRVPFVQAIGGAANVPWIGMHKQRVNGKLVMTLPKDDVVSGKHALVIDDICSSGKTLQAAISLLFERGVVGCSVYVTHALHEKGKLCDPSRCEEVGEACEYVPTWHERFIASGIAVYASDSVIGCQASQVQRVSIVGILASLLQEIMASKGQV